MDKDRERMQLLAEKRQLMVALEKQRVHTVREREAFTVCIDALRRRLLRHGDSADAVIADCMLCCVQYCILHCVLITISTTWI